MRLIGQLWHELVCYMVNVYIRYRHNDVDMTLHYIYNWKTRKWDFCWSKPIKVKGFVIKDGVVIDGTLHRRRLVKR